MRRLLPPLLGLSLLLTACPGGAPPPVLSVSRDARVLQGRWAGDLVERVSVADLSAGAGRVYLLDGSTWEAERVLVLDAKAGTRLASAPRPGARALASREDGALVVLGGGRLTIHDPQTLEVRAERAAPGGGLSLDGEVATEVFGQAERRRSTRTGELLPGETPLSVAADDVSSDLGWRLAGGRAVRVEDGRSVSGASTHGDPCRLGPGLRAASVESAPGGGVLLGFTDGVVEWRGPDGPPVRALPVSEGCRAVRDLRRVGEEVAFVSGRTSAGPGEVGLLGLADGAVRARAQADLGGLRLTPEGAFQTASRPGAAQPQFEFQPWAAARWTLVRERRLLALDVQTTRRDEDTADVTGTATLAGGRTLTVAGTLSGLGTVLAQWSPLPPPSLAPDLTLLDGPTPVGRLVGSTWVVGDTGSADARPQPPAYGVQLRLEGDPQTYEGELRRP